jgi:hypothetical protein
MDIHQQLEYYYQHPPKNLAEFLSLPASLTQIVFDGHGSSGMYPNGLRERLNIVFKIKCKCGGNLYSLVAQSAETEIWHYQDLLVAEFYSLRCVNCGKQALLFDPSLHGYDAETSSLEGFVNEGLSLPKSNAAQLSEDYKCPSCGNYESIIFTRFEYSSDRINDPVFASKLQEFFSWFTVVTECPNCSKLSIAVYYECA